MQNFPHALSAAGRPLNGRGAVHHGLQRRVERTEIGEEQENGADAESVQCVLRADPEDAGRTGRRGQANQTFELQLDVCERECGGQRVARRLFEALVVQFLTSERLHRGDSREGLFNDIVNPAFDFLLLVAAVHHPLRIQMKHHRHVRHHGQGQQGERRIDPPENGEHDDETDERGNDRQQRVPHNDGNTRAIGGHTADVVAHRLAQVEVQRELLQLGEQIGGQVVNHPLPQRDVGVGVGEPNRPTRQENQNRRADRPRDKILRRVRAGQQNDQAGKNGRGDLPLQDVIDQENHRPRLEDVEPDFEQHRSHDDEQLRPAPPGVAGQPAAKLERVRVRCWVCGAHALSGGGGRWPFPVGSPVVELGVQLAAREQLFVGPALGHLPVFQHDDAVGLTNG